MSVRGWLLLAASGLLCVTPRRHLISPARRPPKMPASLPSRCSTRTTTAACRSRSSTSATPASTSSSRRAGWSVCRPFCSARRSAIASLPMRVAHPGRPTLDERTTPTGASRRSREGTTRAGDRLDRLPRIAAIHRLRAAPAAERRAERLASPARDDKRISLGCVVVPVEFYESVVAPSLGRSRGVVYVLPESRPARALFDAAMVAGAAETP